MSGSTRPSWDDLLSSRGAGPRPRTREGLPREDPRLQAISAVAHFVAANGQVPNFGELEEALPGVTLGLVRREFGSYFSYLTEALDANTAAVHLAPLSKTHYLDFVQRGKVAPSARAVSILSARDELPAFSEAEAAILLEGFVVGPELPEEEADPEESMESPDDWLDSTTSSIVSDQEEKPSRPPFTSSPLFAEFKDRVHSVDDILGLPHESQERIRDECHSVFAFLAMLDRYRAESCSDALGLR